MVRNWVGCDCVDNHGDLLFCERRFRVSVLLARPVAHANEIHVPAWRWRTEVLPATHTYELRFRLFSLEAHARRISRNESSLACCGHRGVLYAAAAIRPHTASSWNYCRRLCFDADPG